MMLTKFKIQQRMDRFIRNNNDIATITAVAAIGIRISHVLVAVKTFTSLPTITGLNGNPGLVNKCHKTPYLPIFLIASAVR